MPASRRSVTASASADWTFGLAVLRPAGVLTGLFGSNGVEKTERSPVGELSGSPPGVARARVAKRRKRIAPFESRLSWRSQAASTGQASLTSTGPELPT